MVTPEQVAQARQEAADSEEFVDAVDILKKKGIVQEQELLAMLAQQYGMELLDLSHYDIPQEVIDSMSGDIALHYRVVPVMKHDNLLTIAMSDPTDMETLDTLRYLLGGDVDAVIAPQRQIDLQIAKHYADDIPQEVKDRRLAEIMELQEAISLETNRSKIGTTLKVIVDREEPDYFVGRTEFDSPEVDPEVLIKKNEQVRIGEFCQAKITDALPFELMAEVANA